MARAPYNIYAAYRDAIRNYGAYGLGRQLTYNTGQVLLAGVTFGAGKKVFVAGGYLFKSAGGTIYKVTVTNLNAFVTNPKLLLAGTPAEWHNFFKHQGFNPRPLGHGSVAGIPFESGGGFRVNWGSGNYLHFHPGSIHHGNVPYWKVSWSSGGPPGKASGTVRFDMHGNPVP